MKNSNTNAHLKSKKALKSLKFADLKAVVGGGDYGWDAPPPDLLKP